MSKNKCCLEKSAIEYQPDAIELANQRLPWWGRHGLLWMALFFAGAMLWACFSDMDIIVEGIGKVVSADPPITMKPWQTTVIESVDVKVGDRVKAGQTLITFDPTLAQADEERLTKDRNIYTAQLERLKCEFEGKPYLPSNITNPDVERQFALYKQRKSFYDEKMKYYDSSIKRIDEAMSSKRVTLANLERQLEAINKIMSMYTELLSKEATSTKEYLQVQISKLQAEAETDSTRNSLQEYEQARQTTIAEKNSFIQEWKQNVSEQLITADKYLNDTLKSLDKVKMQESYVELKAPSEAMVHEIASFSKGSAVREAEPLITLIPLNGEMLLEAEIPTRDIGKVKVGDQVRIKVTAFPYQKYGTLEGEIVSISEDAFTQQSQLNEDIGKTNARAFYRARIRFTSKKLRNLDEFRLIPGMEAQAEIKVGKRKVIEYLIYPLIKSLDEAAREP